MAKRFIDTDIFKSDFIRGLEAPYKLLWIYVLNECNHAGIWKVELDVAELRLGIKFSQPPEKVFFSKIVLVDNGKKWFLPSFIEFQYGELNPQNRAHNSVITLLKNHNLIDEEGAIKPLTSPLQGAMDMDKDKDKVMDKEKEAQNSKKTDLDFTFLDLPTNLPFKDTFREWWVYRVKEIKKPFKTQITLQKAFDYMVELSGKSPENAKKIVNQAIANTWQGLQPIKTQVNGTVKKFDTSFSTPLLDSGGRKDFE